MPLTVSLKEEIVTERAVVISVSEIVVIAISAISHESVCMNDRMGIAVRFFIRIDASLR